MDSTVRKLVLVIAVAMSLVFAASAPAQAATSWTHNNRYSFSNLKNTPWVGQGYVIEYMYNDSPVTMLCWLDTAWVYDRNYSNYNSPRWFKVRSNYTGRVGYVHSSYVYYQQWTPRC